MLIILKESGEEELEPRRLTPSNGTTPTASFLHVGTCCKDGEAASRAHLHSWLVGALERQAEFHSSTQDEA